MQEPVIYKPKQDIAGVRPYFVLPNDTYPSYFDEFGGAPEAAVITWAEQFLPKEGNFVDIGSHLGTYSLTYALKGYHVQAFEAQPWVYKLFRCGEVLNNLDGYPAGRSRCNNYAIGAEAATMQLTAPHDDGGGGSIVCNFENPAITMDVRVVPLDYVQPKMDLLKIDVEGAELDVLKGAATTIRKFKPVILFECWDDERGQRREELFKYLTDNLKYKVQGISWPETYLATPMGV